MNCDASINIFRKFCLIIGNIKFPENIEASCLIHLSFYILFNPYIVKAFI
ncbi:hypothetical protein GPSY_0522 [Paraglaciecola psychrophila 170]|nr:hypothetical protein GPSY_0522 [Paraglaciecola psychrophila 170]